MRKLLILAIIGTLFGHVRGEHANTKVTFDFVANNGAVNQIDDEVTLGRVSGQGTKIVVEVFAKGVTTSLVGLKIDFDFDDVILKLNKVENSAFLFAIPEATGINFGHTAPVILPESGFIGRAEFFTVADVTDLEFFIGIKRITFARTSIDAYKITSSAQVIFNSLISPPPPVTPVTPVPSNTQLLAATQDSLRQVQGLLVTTLINLQEVQSNFVAVRDTLRRAKFGDLDFNGIVDFKDFLIFTGNYGKDIN